MPDDQTAERVVTRVQTRRLRLNTSVIHGHLFILILIVVSSTFLAYTNHLNANITGLLGTIGGVSGTAAGIKMVNGSLSGKGDNENSD